MLRKSINSCLNNCSFLLNYSIKVKQIQQNRINVISLINSKSFNTCNSQSNNNNKYSKTLNNIKNLNSPRFSLRYSSASNASAYNDTTNNSGNKLDSEFLARQFINTLTTDEREIIKQELLKIEKENNEISELNTGKPVSDITFNQLFMVCLQNGLPFIGFGFIDNFLMIVAGDMIETYIGIFLPISTMAAAGLGNGFSDVAGIGLAHHIEYFCSKLMNTPKLSPEQWNKRIVVWSIVISKSLCIFLGCIIGMTPLLFIDHKDKEKKNENEKTK